MIFSPIVVIISVKYSLMILFRNESLKKVWQKLTKNHQDKQMRELLDYIQMKQKQC